MTIVNTARAPSPAVSTPILMCTWRPRWTRSAGCWAWRASTRRCGQRRVVGLVAVVRAGGPDRGGGHRFLWRRTGPIAAPRRCRGGRGRPAQPAGAAPSRQVRSARRGGGGPGRPVRASCGAAKTRDGNVEAIRALVVAKRSARSTKIKALNQIRHLGFTAPDELRARLKGCSRQHLAAEAAALRPRPMAMRS